MFVGDESVGKSNIVSQIVNGTFRKCPQPNHCNDIKTDVKIKIL